MRSETWKKSRDLFEAALGMPESDRDRFLQSACAGDPDLLQLVQQMLLDDQSAESADFLESLPLALDALVQEVSAEVLADTQDIAQIMPPDPKQIGPYHIKEKIGEGGMGVVYLAEQEKPLRRRVALKVVRLGLETTEVIARFEVERQALALMSHPSIAQILDAGSTDTGRPYFVMEYVPGMPITEYCDHHRLDTRERLELFRQVCDAVQHAHQKGVIHRDLKPSNILVADREGTAHPTVIDFGIAKAISQPFVEGSPVTRLGQLLGTIEYMSPEQTDIYREDIDTRSDTYSLGVILYELLVGSRPFIREELGEAAQAEVVRTIREEDPPRPSARLSTLNRQIETVARLRRTESGRLLRQLRGELDWITMKALEKDRSRRYTTLNDLAADISRFLRDEPILARPPSVLYRTRKFISRNRIAVSLALGALIAVLSFAVAMAVQADRIANERNLARTAAQRAKANEIAAFGFNKLREDPTAAAAYGLSSLKVNDGPQARALLAQAVRRGPFHREMAAMGPFNPIAADISPDGNWCAVGWSRNGAVTVHSLPSWDHQIVNGEDGPVAPVEFTSDSRYLLTSHASTVSIWSLPEKSLVRSVQLEGRAQLWPLDDPHHVIILEEVPGKANQWLRLRVPDGGVDTLGVSLQIDPPAAAADPRGRWLAETKDGRIFLRPLSNVSGSMIEVGRSGSRVTGLTFDREGRWLAVSEQNGTTQIWELTSDLPVSIRTLHQDPRSPAVIFDPYGPRVLSLGNWGSGVAKLWDLTLPPIARPYRFLDRCHWVHDACFLPDGSILTLRNGVGIALWNSPTEVPIVLEANTLRSQHLVALSPDGDWLVTAVGSDRQIVQVPLGSGIKGTQRTLAEPGWDFDSFPLLPPDTPYAILFYRAGGEMVVLDLDAVAICRTEALDKGVQSTTMEISRTGRRVAASKAGTDGETPNRLHVYDRSTGTSMEYPRSFLGDAQFQTGMSWSFWGEDSLLVLREDTLRVWNLVTHEEQLLWTGDAKDAVFARGGAGLVVKDSAGHMKWIVPGSGRSRPIGTWPGGLIYGVAYRDSVIAVSGESNDLFVYSLRNNQTWTLHASINQWNVWFDPLGRYLFVRMSDTSVWMWPLPLSPDIRTAPLHEILNDLGERTNLRAVEDSNSVVGYRLAVPGATWPLALEPRY